MRLLWHSIHRVAIHTAAAVAAFIILVLVVFNIVFQYKYARNDMVALTAEEEEDDDKKHAGCRVNVCDMALKKFTFTYQITVISVFGFETVCYF